MIYLAIAYNVKTNEEAVLGAFDSADEAWWNINFNLEWDENDIKENWQFMVQEITEDFDNVDETGFDPYMGCYSDDC